MVRAACSRNTKMSTDKEASGTVLELVKRAPAGQGLGNSNVEEKNSVLT